MELSELQKKILNAPEDKIVVLSSAASGKTRLMTEKVRQLLRAGINPKEIAVITFTNMAAAELRQRLGEDYKEGLFVGTIHALANYMLCSSGINTRQVLDEENFDKLFEMIEKNPSCVRHMEWILLDEAQDTDASQFKFLLEMIKPDYFFFVGDIKQSIYGWRGARPDLLQKLCKKSEVTVFDLNENYRNGYNILKYAKRIIAPNMLEDNSVSMRSSNGAVYELPFSYETICNKILEKGNFGDWAILTRVNKEIEDLSVVLRKAGIPFDTFKQGDLSKEELTKKMEQNTVKVLTVHSAKGLEWDNVIVLGMRFSSFEERNVCYVAATRARNNLIWLTRAKKRRRTPRMSEW